MVSFALVMVAGKSASTKTVQKLRNLTDCARRTEEVLAASIPIAPKVVKVAAYVVPMALGNDAKHPAVRRVLHADTFARLMEDSAVAK